MTRNFLFVTLFVVLATGLAEARVRGVQVKATVEALVETEPNRTVTAAFQVTNKWPATTEFTTKVRIPKGWKLITQDFRFTLGINKSDIRLLSFQVPQGAMAGRYRVVWTVEARRHPSLWDSDTLDVLVLPITNIEARLLDAPPYALAGERYDAVFLVTNRSNSTNTVNTSTKSEPDVPVDLDPDKFVLQPGETKEVTARVKTDPKTKRLIEHRIRFLAQAAGEKPAEVSVTSHVQIVPRVTEAEDRFHRIPGNVAVRYLNQRNQRNTSGFQAEAFWQGSLGADGSKHVALLVRGPTMDERSLLGRREEYRLSFFTKGYEFHLGDHNYQLSMLTQNQYGRGAKARVTIAPLSLTGYYCKPRWSAQEDQNGAAQASISLGQRCEIALGALARVNQDSRDNFVTAKAHFMPIGNTDVQTEYVMSQSNTGSETKSDYACAIGVRANPEWFSLWLRYIHAEPDYVGRYEDTDFLSGNIGAPIGRNLRLYAGLQRGTYNLDLDTALVSAALDQHGQLGLRYALSSKSNLFLEYKRTSREDLLLDPDFDYTDNTYAIGGGHTLEKVAINGSFELGTSENNLTGQSGDLKRYSASSHFRPMKNQVFSAFVRYTDRTLHERENARSISAGLKSSLQFGSTSSLHLCIQTDDFREPYYGDRDRFSTEFCHTLPNKSVISLRGICTSDRNSDENDELALMLEYSLPLSLPVGLKTGIGNVRGFVYDQNTKKPMEKVILRLNGSAAITDSRGSFVFRNLKVGTYRLDVDAGKSGLDMLIAERKPIKISVEANEETFVRIAMTQKASVLGRVILYDENRRSSNMAEGEKDYFVVGEGRAESGLARAYMLPNMLVELVSETETKKRLTDNRGYFRFDDVCPGEWTLRIGKQNLPEYHRLEKESVEFVLKPGDKEETLIRIFPERRRIRIIKKRPGVLREIRR